ncbi:hypothetical protein [Companilactobacillus keshanensis]|uniref:hypothetical protein n=1 Tax=Companilactobacillus keshanensis TaxID=2486003 RepID=UPI0013DDD981|nr:hypothetical protein [Companilactobacillus keshanensis]
MDQIMDGLHLDPLLLTINHMARSDGHLPFYSGYQLDILHTIISSTQNKELMAFILE